MRKLLLLLPLIASMCGPPAYAQSNCADRTLVVDNLKKKYDETPVFVGLVTNGSVVEILVNKSTGSWTAIITYPDSKISCLVAIGNEFLLLEAAKGERL